MFNQPLSFDTSSVTTMRYMFLVRCPVPAPNQQSSLPLRDACTAVARHLPPPDPHLAPHRMPSLRSSAQYASAFNQPLSFDTSKVTIMQQIFYVRSAPCPAPNQ